MRGDGRKGPQPNEQDAGSAPAHEGCVVWTCPFSSSPSGRCVPASLWHHHLAYPSPWLALYFYRARNTFSGASTYPQAYNLASIQAGYLLCLVRSAPSSSANQPRWIIDPLYGVGNGRNLPIHCTRPLAKYLASIRQRK